MEFEVEAVEVIPRKVEEVFREAAGEAAPIARYFTGMAPLIPGVVEASVDGGGAHETGALRTVKLGDGTVIKERVLALEAPHLHRYDMVEMNATQRLLLTNMVAEWRFEDVGGATRVRWRYTFHPRNAAVAPATWVMAKLFRVAMQRCLQRLAAALR